MSGSFNELDVPPTLVSFAVGMSEASKTASAQFKRAGSKVVMAELPVNEETGLPAYDKAMNFMVSVYEGVRSGAILSASLRLTQSLKMQLRLVLSMKTACLLLTARYSLLMN